MSDDLERLASMRPRRPDQARQGRPAVARFSSWSLFLLANFLSFVLGVLAAGLAWLHFGR